MFPPHVQVCVYIHIKAQGRSVALTDCGRGWFWEPHDVPRTPHFSSFYLSFIEVKEQLLHRPGADSAQCPHCHLLEQGGADRCPPGFFNASF